MTVISMSVFTVNLSRLVKVFALTESLSYKDLRIKSRKKGVADCLPLDPSTEETITWLQ